MEICQREGHGDPLELKCMGFGCNGKPICFKCQYTTQHLSHKCKVRQGYGEPQSQQVNSPQQSEQENRTNVQVNSNPEPNQKELKPKLNQKETLNPEDKKKSSKPQSGDKTYHAQQKSVSSCCNLI